MLVLHAAKADLLDLLSDKLMSQICFLCTFCPVTAASGGNRAMKHGWKFNYIVGKVDGNQTKLGGDQTKLGGNQTNLDGIPTKHTLSGILLTSIFCPWCMLCS